MPAVLSVAPLTDTFAAKTTSTSPASGSDDAFGAVLRTLRAPASVSTVVAGTVANDAVPSFPLAAPVSLAPPPPPSAEPRPALPAGILAFPASIGLAAGPASGAVSDAVGAPAVQVPEPAVVAALAVMANAEGKASFMPVTPGLAPATPKPGQAPNQPVQAAVTREPAATGQAAQLVSPLQPPAPTTAAVPLHPGLVQSLRAQTAPQTTAGTVAPPPIDLRSASVGDEASGQAGGAKTVDPAQRVAPTPIATTGEPTPLPAAPALVLAASPMLPGEAAGTGTGTISPKGMTFAKAATSGQATASAKPAPSAQPDPSGQPAPSTQPALSAHSAPSGQLGTSGQLAASAQSAPPAQPAPSARLAPTARLTPSAQTATPKHAAMTAAVPVPGQDPPPAIPLPQAASLQAGIEAAQTFGDRTHEVATNQPQSALSTNGPTTAVVPPAAPQQATPSPETATPSAVAAPLPAATPATPDPAVPFAVAAALAPQANSVQNPVPVPARPAPANPTTATATATATTPAVFTAPIAQVMNGQDAPVQPIAAAPSLATGATPPDPETRPPTASTQPPAPGVANVQQATIAPPPGRPPATDTASTDSPAAIAAPDRKITFRAAAAAAADPSQPIAAATPDEPQALPVATLAPAPPAVSSVAPASQAQPAAPAEQVAPALLTLAKTADGSHQMTIRLQPAELGMVQVQIQRVPSGATQIIVTAEKVDTLQALQRDQPQLHRALDEAGIPAAGRTMSFHIAEAEPSSSGTGTSNQHSGRASADTANPDGSANPDTGAGRESYQSRGSNAYSTSRRSSGTPETALANAAAAAKSSRAGLDITA